MRRRKVTGCATPLPTLHPLVLVLHPLITASALAGALGEAQLVFLGLVESLCIACRALEGVQATKGKFNYLPLV